MRVGVDGWRIHGTTGVPRYLSRIVAAWCGEEGSLGRAEAVTVYTPKPIDRERVPLGGRVREDVLPSTQRQLVWQNRTLGKAVVDDVLWCPSYTRPLRFSKPTVVTTHDVTYKLFPRLYPLANRLFYDHLYAWCARTATLVVTHNESTADAIMRHLGVPSERIRVVPLAPSKIFHRIGSRSSVEEARLRILGDDRPYFLSVGTMSVRRNMPIIIQGFRRLKERSNLPHRLVLVGKNKLGRSILQIASEHGVADDVSYLGFVDDDDLLMLYNGADGFVTAATHEGNSLTSLEAQATGAPVIIPDVRGMREMTNDIAVVLPEVTPEAIAGAMERLALDEDLRRRLAEEGIEYSTGFSWTRSAEETMAVITEAAERGS